MSWALYLSLTIVFLIVFQIYILVENLRLKKQLLLAAKNAAQPNHPLLDPLRDAPVPAFRVTQRGQFVWFNQAFRKIFFEHKIPRDIQDAARQLACPDLNSIKQDGFVKQLHVKLDDGRENHYGVIRWESQNGRVNEISCILLPQNSHSKKVSAQHRFEHDIIRFLRSTLVSGTTNDPDVHEVLETLEVLQPEIRKHSQLQRVNIVPILQKLTEMGGPLRLPSTTLTFTSPHTAYIHSQSSEVSLLFELISSAIEELQPSGRIALRIKRQTSYYQIDIQLHDYYLKKEEIQRAKILSEESSLSIHTRLRLALAEQLVIKMHGEFSIASEHGLGTIFEVKLQAVEKE